LVLGEKVCFKNITNNTNSNVKCDKLLQYWFNFVFFKKTLVFQIKS